MKFPESNDVNVLTHVDSVDVAAPITPLLPQVKPEPQLEGGNPVQVTPSDANVIPQENEQSVGQSGEQ